LQRAAMPEFVPVSNPVDLTAQALVDPDLYRRTLSALLQDDRVGSVLFGIIQTDATTSNIKFPPIISAVQDLKPRKAVIFAGLDEGAAVPPQYIARLRALGVPYFPAPDRALRAVAAFNALATRDLTVSPALPTPLAEPPPLGVVAEYRAKQLLATLGIPFPSGQFVTSLEQAQAAAMQLGFPLVLKAQSADLSHKSDAGGVVLGLTDATQLAEGWTRLHADIARHRPGLVLEGVLIEKMGKRGVELIVGARNDPEWGPVVLAGFGGVQAEILNDVRLLPADLTREGIVRELHLLKSGALLRGFRGSPALDVAAVAEVIARIGRLLLAEPTIREIDLNPVIAYPEGEGAVALDALMLVGDSAS
jgi:acyl-CoA synthetase (NDP forming)